MLTFDDLTHAAARQDPHFATLVLDYLDQPDPPQDRPELSEVSPAADLPAEDEDDLSSLFVSPSHQASATGKTAGSRKDDEDEDYDDDDYDEDEDYDDDEDEDYDDDGDDDDAEHASSTLPDGAWSLQDLKDALHPNKLKNLSVDERRALRLESWKQLFASPFPPPRLKLGELLVSLYESGSNGTGTEWARSALLAIFRKAPLKLGLWQGFKTIFKRAEARYDAEMYGLLTWRIDTTAPTGRGLEVSGATLLYLRRRAWRFLRQLGGALPELYIDFATQVLSAFGPDDRLRHAWSFHQILGHKTLIGKGGQQVRTSPPYPLDRRAFPDAWKHSPAPLLRLLEDAQHDDVCDFAIRSLKADFSEQLRAVSPSWIARIGRRPVEALHTFVVALLTENPAFHQSRLKELGLHALVLELLHSSSEAARTYAVAYARAHAPELPVLELVKLASSDDEGVQKLALSRLAQLTPGQLGLDALIALLEISEAESLALDKLGKGFKPTDLSIDHYLKLVSGSNTARKFVAGFYQAAQEKVPASYLLKVLEDPDGSYRVQRDAATELGKRSGNEIGFDWIKKALLDDTLSSYAGDWLKAGKFKEALLDIEWLKLQTNRPQLRDTALEVLGNKALVSPSRLGIPWLFELLRRPEAALHEFAHRMLLEHIPPQELSPEGGLDSVLDLVIRLLVSDQESEQVQAFAMQFIQAHHPELSAAVAEAQSLGIKPWLKSKHYTLARFQPLFESNRPDIRTMAMKVLKVELVRWHQPNLLFVLANSRYRETRKAALRILGQIGQKEVDSPEPSQEGAQKELPPADWLVPSNVFRLAESPHKDTREVAVGLIRRHYQQLGGATQLRWLMESSDRTVRLFAVRLLWENHRLTPIPSTWKPKKGAGLHTTAFEGETESTDTHIPLRQFLEQTLFGLPPGRSEQAAGGEKVALERPLSASVAKRRMLEVVRDLAVEDPGFAEVVVPVLEAFTHAQAKGEWQGSVAALARIRRGMTSSQA